MLKLDELAEDLANFWFSAMALASWEGRLKLIKQIDAGLLAGLVVNERVALTRGTRPAAFSASDTPGSDQAEPARRKQSGVFRVRNAQWHPFFFEIGARGLNRFLLRSKGAETAHGWRRGWERCATLGLRPRFRAGKGAKKGRMEGVFVRGLRWIRTYASVPSQGCETRQASLAPADGNRCGPVGWVRASSGRGETVEGRATRPRRAVRPHEQDRVSIG